MSCSAACTRDFPGTSLIYSTLYKTLLYFPNRLNLVPTISSTDQKGAEVKESDEEKANITEDLEDEVNAKAVEPIQVLEPKEWEKYLKKIDVGQSAKMLQNAMVISMPIRSVESVWLSKVKDCPLFLEMVWYPSVEKAPSTPIVKGDLLPFIQDCAARWLVAIDLDRRVADGTISFQDMEKVIRLQQKGKFLAQAHLPHIKPIQLVNESYRDFEILLKLQNSIGPFIASLRLFRIFKREAIDTLTDCINDHLLNNWAQSTLKQVRESGIIEMI